MMRRLQAGAVPGPMFLRLSAGLCGVLLVLAAGCPTNVGGGTGTNANDNTNANSNDNASDGIEVDLVSVRTNRQISVLEDFFSVLYTVTGASESATVEAFSVAVDPADPEVEIGERTSEPEWTDLPTGTNQQFRFYPERAGVGLFRVGLLVSDAGIQQEFLSEGIIEVQGAPSPRFIQPLDPVTVVSQGQQVTISFDAGDPEGRVQWRLFRLVATDPLGDPPAITSSQVGTQLAVGSGNSGFFSLQTADLEVGRYEIGLSATDSGESVATTFEEGDAALVVSIPNESTLEIDRRVIEVEEATATVPASIAFSAPGAADVQLFGDEAFDIRFSVTTDPTRTAFVDVFYDSDTNPDNGVSLIPGATNLPPSTVSVALPSGIPEGTYRVGATVRQGSDTPVTVYADGAVVIVRTPTLSVLTPQTTLPIRPAGPGDPENTVEITWSTNVPPSVGIVDVFARNVDVGGVPFGPEIELLAPTSTDTTSTQFNSDVSGTFRVFVRLSVSDGSFEPLTRQAPALIRVSSAPRILWLGSLTVEAPPFDGALFEGVNFEDNAGTTFSPVDDLNGDGLGEFIIGARYAKPFFMNPTGVGTGEAYLLYGRGGSNKLLGPYNLNAVGQSALTGVTFAGIRTPQQNAADTSGMSSVSRLPDVDGDGRDEMVFGFPDTMSRGHNVSPAQDGVIDPRRLATLEREGQFLRGGIVIVSSRNSVLSSPTIGDPVINLDLVGQDFDVTCVDPEPDSVLPDDVDEFFVDVHSDVNEDNEGCDGDCINPNSGGKPDATNFINFGFVSALARDYFATYVYSFEFWHGVRFCASVDPFLHHECLRDADPPVPHEYCSEFSPGCEPFSPGLHNFATDPDGQFLNLGAGNPTDFVPHTRRSGFYSAFVPDPANNDAAIRNNPREPLGARILGVAFDDMFGTSLTLSNSTGNGAGDIIVSSPARTARGILLGPQGGPDAGGEINGLESSPGTAKINGNSGVAYIFPLRSLWTSDALGRMPPKPHQYIVGEASHCGGSLPVIDNIVAKRIAGFENDRITNIVGIEDFNDDGLNDFAIGAPTANSGQGRVYVAFRRAPGLEGDYVLEKLAFDPEDPERLTGVLLITDSVDSLGSSLTSGVDFNGDGISDLVIGSPDAGAGTGSVIVVFGDPNLTSPENGILISTLLETRNAQGLPRAARITGNPLDPSGQFGFNVANAGDVDGDGFNDLLVAAPGATPRFDPDPTDTVDILTAVGVDNDFDGVQDDVTGVDGRPPDGIITNDDNLDEAGIVYIISGSNRLDQIRTCTGTDVGCNTDNDCDAGQVCASSDLTINVNQLGTSQLEGFMVVGRRQGDRIGGGDAGNVAQGGNDSKRDRGRSKGLASAGDVDGDGRDDVLIGSVLADPRRDPNTGVGVQNGGEAYLLYGTVAP